MTWESPNLSKGDIELLTIVLDEYLYIANDLIPEKPKIEKLLDRLNVYLKRSLL